MLVVIAENLPDAVRGKMKLWFIEQKPNVFVSSVADALARKVVLQLLESCTPESGMLIVESRMKSPGYVLWEKTLTPAIETVTEKDPAAAAFIVKTTQYFVPMAGKIDAEAERRKLTDELSYQEGFLASVMKKLSNERFMQSAPEKVVANERAKQADAEAKIAAIKAQLEALS